ncbi:MAG: hypothetical protein WCN88_01040 [Candidatus Falkowbacteria bacterium]
MNKLRKFLVIGVMAITVLATMGMYAPVNASASAGDLIKMSGLSSVYYLGSDGKRYVFPNEATYMSWYNDFNGVVTIPASELQSYPLGGNVVMRAGTKLVKITTDPSVYAVEPNGVLRKIQSEAQAAALFGTNWNKRVVDVSDAFFTNYTIGAVLANGVIPAGSLVKNASGAEIFYFDGTNYRSIANEAAFNANRFAWGNIITASSTVTAGGSNLSSGEFVNVAQNGGTGIVITGSGLMVSLNASTPAAASVPQNGARVPMAKINLTAANDGAVSVNSILVKRIGLSSYSDVNQVWMEKDGSIVASKKTVNSNDESILTFSPALIVNAGQTVTLDLIASLKGSGGNMGFSIASASAVSSTGATVSGSFPVSGNVMSLTSYNVVNLSITTTAATQSVKVGDEKVELGSFELGFNSTAKDVTVSSIMLKNNGVEDLSKTAMNLYLEQAGNKVSTGVTVNGRYVTFTFGSGLNLLKDDSSKIFKIKGDVIGKENTGTPSYTFTLNKSTDLIAYEKSTGFGANVLNGTSGSVSADNMTISNVNITSGAISVSKKSTSPSDTTIVKGSDNIVLLANVKTDEAMNADGLNISYSSDGSQALTTDQFENVRVYVNGVLLDSFDPATTTAVISKSIDSNLSLVKGDNEIKVMAKAKTNATNNAAFIAKLVTGVGSDALFASKNPTYVSSGNAIAAGSIGGSATGATFTVAGAVISVTRNDGYSAGKTIVKGSNDVSLGKFTLKATNDALTVTSISLAGNSTASTSTTTDSSIFDAKVYVDGVQVGNTVDFTSTGANFSSLNFSIAKDTTKSVEIKASFDSSATGGFKTVMTVNAQDSRGKEITTNNTASTVDFNVTSAGSLNVALGGNTPAAAILVAKAAEQEVAQIKFTAINDSASITEINVINWDGVSATSTTADPRIASVKLYDGSNLLDSFVPVNGAGKFTISNDAALIAANNSKTLSVKVSLNPIDNDSAATDKDLMIRVTTVKSKSSAGSVTSLTANVNANSFRIRKTVPTVTLAALPSTLLTAGNTVVSKFTVSADSNGDVALGKIVLNYSTSSDVVLNTAVLANAVKVNGVTKSATSTVSIANKTITIDFTQSAEEIVSAGTSKTIEILANIVSVGNNSQSLTTTIAEPSTYTDGGSTTFQWSDGASITAATYSSGRRVPGLSTDTQVLSKN